MLVQTGDMRDYQARGDIRPKAESRIDCNARGNTRRYAEEGGSKGTLRVLSIAL